MTQRLKDKDDPDRGKGRPTKYRKTWPKKAHKHAKEGYTDKEIAEKFGVHPSTFVELKKRHPELKEAVQAGAESKTGSVVRSLGKLADGFKTTDTTTVTTTVKRTIDGKEVEETTEIVTAVCKEHAPNERACRTWLYNKAPDEWRDKKEFNVNTTAPKGPPVLVFGDAPAETTDPEEKPQTEEAAE